MKLLLQLQFLGTDFCGYQVQPRGRTVQGTLNEATERLFGFPCDVVGCSRTDSGVHANVFFATVAKKGERTLVTSVPDDKLTGALNALLPPDLAVVSARWVSDEFHARYDVRYKEYVYRLYASDTKDPFLLGRACFYKRPLTDEAVERMQRAAGYFVGRHDFASYMAAGSKVSSTVREVKYADVYREGREIVFRVAADGFLYNMVRIMMGTLLAVAEGKAEPEDVPAMTAARDRTATGMTAPACGLYLNQVVYHE